jgi:hypothetical protein
MQLETDQHWYALFGFFFTQQSDEQKLEIMQPWTREKVLVEMFDILKNGRDDRLKINLLIFLEENYQFFFSTHPTVFQGTCTLLNELLTLPTAPKVVGNARDPSGVSYTPYTPNHVKTQVLITLTTILIASEAIYRQPSTIESLVDILFEIIMHVNDSHDRLLRQTAAEALRELASHFSGLLVGRLGLLFRLAREERLHVKLSYTSLFSTALSSSIQCIGQLGDSIVCKEEMTAEAKFQQFEETLRTIGLGSPAGSGLRLFDASSTNELASFQLPAAPAFGQSHHFQIPAPLPLNWIHHFRNDLELAANFLLEQIPLTTTFEAVRLAQQLTYLLQSSFVSKDTFDDVADNSLPGYSSTAKSINISTELLIRPDRLAALIRWALQTNQPILWSIANIILSRIPIEMIQHLTSRNSDLDTIATTQSLNLMLRDDVLLLLKPNLFNVPDVVRILLLEWISRRPIHSDAEHCAHLITTPPSRLVPDREGKQSVRVLTSFPAHHNAGSPEHAKKFHSKISLLYPSAFDNAQMAMAKLIALSYGYAGSGLENRIPKSFMKSMSIFNDFPVSFISSKSLFQVIAHYLTHFPSQFDYIMQFLQCVMTEHVSFANQVWELVNSDAIRVKSPGLFNRCIARLCEQLTTLSPPLLFNYVPLILELVKLRESKVDTLLEALRLNLRVSKQLRDGEWVFGNSLLEIVHIVLLHHDIRHLLTPACNLLSTLADCFADFEIRDRAHFYLQLLTQIPADKIRAIVEVTEKTMSENLDVDNPFVNAESSKLQGFQPISFSSSTTSSSDPNHPPTTHPNLLVLDQTSNHYNLNSLVALHAKQIQSEETADPNDDSPVLAFYRAQVARNLQDQVAHGHLIASQAASNESTEKPFQLDSSNTCVHIPLLLRFKTPVEIEKEGVTREMMQRLPHSLYSISLKLTGSSLYSHESHTVAIPFLASCFANSEGDHAGKSASGPKYGIVSNLLENDGNSLFPYSYSFVLSLNVLFPLPTTFSVQALANTAEGAVAELNLEKLTIPLHYLFMPIPQHFSMPKMSYKAFLQALFEEMWETMTNGSAQIGNTQSDLQTNVTAPSSVKYIAKPSKFVQNAIRTHLSPFIVSESQELVKLLIFLPHRYHLLLRVEISDSSTVIRIISDWWRTMTHLDSYFESIFNLIV